MSERGERELGRADAERLAAFLRGLRQDWYLPEITDALGHARNRKDGPDGYVIACAAIRFAADPSNTTPAGIAKDGWHWRPWTADTIERPGTPTPARHESLRCDKCGLLNTEGEDHHCARISDAHEGRARVDQALAAARATHTDTEEDSDASG